MSTAPKMAATTRSAAAPSVEEQMLEIVRGLLTELGSHRARQAVSLHSSFDRDLGLGSLERVELLVRCEQRFERRLPDEIAQRAETPAEWVQALLDGSSATEKARTRYRIEQPSREARRAPNARTWVEVLRHYAEVEPDRVHIHLLDDLDVKGGQDITYGELFESASSVAAGLVVLGMRPNDPVAIMLPTSADFFFAFFGVMLAGGIAIPIYPPARPDRIEQYVRRQVQILRQAEVRFLITFDRVKAVSEIMRVSIPSLAAVSTVRAIRHNGAKATTLATEPGDPFFIQYTSGSTGNPKGVVLTHANALANVRGIGWAVKVRPTDTVVTWLPLYHDMGLIGSWLFSVYYVLPITILSPLAFLSRPERWLWALHDSQGTLCPAPNFSYELCARKIVDQALEGLDLSAWRVAINAGEAVLPETLERFAARFRPYGFRAESFVPCYGLAESSVALTFPPLGRAPLIDTIRRDLFEKEGKAVSVSAPPGDTRHSSVLRFVACGAPLPDHEVRILDDQGRELGERVQGRLLFRGPSQTPGYFRNPVATTAVVTEEGWMDSGDLAYQAGGELYITGRSKDLIIKSGRNLIPQQAEAAASEVPGVRRGCVAALGLVDPKAGTERFVVVAETRASADEELRRIEMDVIKKVDGALGIPPDAVVLVPPQTIPKTSSGKIRRNETRALYERGELKTAWRPPWLQIVRLGSESLGSWIGAGRARIGLGLRRMCARSVSLLIGTSAGVWARLVVIPWAAAPVVRLAARCLLRLAGQPASLQGNELLGRTGSVVLIANRASPYDPLVMTAGLAFPFLIAEQTSLRALPWEARFLLEPRVILPLDGQSVPRGGTLRARLHHALIQGHSVVVFAEGPLGAPARLSRFRLDAFYAAVATGSRIHPVAISRGNPQETVAATIGAAIAAEAGDRGVAALRDEVREAMAKLQGFQNHD